MRRPLIAVLLYSFLHVAAAQSEVLVPAAPGARQGVEGANKAMPTPAVTRPGGELIKTVAAGTHKPAPLAREANAPTQPNTEDQPRRGGTAMLLAALALMLGIVLRRYGANR